MKHPSYLYDWPEIEARMPERWFPQGQPMVQYFDRYKDKQTHAQEALMVRLKESHPYHDEELKLR